MDTGASQYALYQACIHSYSLQMRKLRPNPTYVPYLRPSPPYIIDVRSTIPSFNHFPEIYHSCYLQKRTPTTGQRHSVRDSCIRPRIKLDVQSTLSRYAIFLYLIFTQVL